MRLSFDGGQIVALLLVLFAIAPLTYPGFFQSHSGFLSIYNLFDLERQGHRLDWLPTVGQDFDPFRHSGALPYAVAEAFRWLGHTAPKAILASYALSFLLSAWAMYRWTRRWLGPMASLLSAAVYTYLPYHLMTVYVRGSLADAWILAMWPVVFWSAHGLSDRDRWKRYMVLTLLSLALLCTANLGLGLLTMPFLATYAWVCGGLAGTTAVIVTLLSVAISTGAAHALAAPFNPPVEFSAHFPYLFQLISPDWNIDGQAGHWINGLPLQVGLPALGLGLLTLVLMWLGRSRSAEEGAPNTNGLSTHGRRSLRYWFIVAVAVGLLVLARLDFVWHVLGWNHLVTYPWQLLGLMGFALAVLGGATVALDWRLRPILVRTGLVTFVVLASYNYLSPRFFDFDINFTPGEKLEHRHVMVPRQAPIAILGDNQVALLDYRLEGPLRHGATVRVNLLWQALRPLQKDYVAFVHAVDGEGTIWGQRDQEPRAGEYPTSKWGQGEIVADRYEFQIDLAGPREGYHLAIGMYDQETGERLNVGPRTRILIQGE